MKRAACMRRDEERNTKLFYKLRCRDCLEKAVIWGRIKMERTERIFCRFTQQ